MAKSIDLASRRAAFLLGYIPAVSAFVAPSPPPGASAAIFDRLSHSRTLTEISCGAIKDRPLWRSG